MQNTINNGENLFVDFPGYSDYRHVPVIGKGVTFQLPGSPDTWGMMCEADLEEVYRVRSIGFSIRNILCYLYNDWSYSFQILAALCLSHSPSVRFL